MKNQPMRMFCPICGGRVFDISGVPEKALSIEMKCPKCRKIVKIECRTRKEDNNENK